MQDFKIFGQKLLYLKRERDFFFFVWLHYVSFITLMYATKYKYLDSRKKHRLFSRMQKNNERKTEKCFIVFIILAFFYDSLLTNIAFEMEIKP